MREPPWLSDEQQTVWRQYLTISRAVQDRIERDMQRVAGIPAAYYLILAMLSEAPGRALRMNQLAEVLNASQSRTSHAVSRLEEHGWLRREKAEQDGRGQLAVLTDDGWQHLLKISPDHAETVRSSLFDPLDESDLADLRRIYGKVVRALDTGAARNG